METRASSALCFGGICPEMSERSWKLLQPHSHAKTKPTSARSKGSGGMSPTAQLQWFSDSKGFGYGITVAINNAGGSYQSSSFPAWRFSEGKIRELYLFSLWEQRNFFLAIKKSAMIFQILSDIWDEPQCIQYNHITFFLPEKCSREALQGCKHLWTSKCCRDAILKTLCWENTEWMRQFSSNDDPHH